MNRIDPGRNLDSDPDPQCEGIDLLAEDFAARWRRGEQPSLNEYVARHPEWAEEIRSILPTVALMEQLKRQRRRDDDDGERPGLGSGPLAASPPSPPLDRLGDLRIVREIGRGGMGIVYEAFQEALGRRVALKVLPRHAFLKPRMLDRFRREAQAVAQLQHPHIVPVFGVGEQDGLHYYVMQLINGRGLHALIRALRRGTTVAKALEQTQSTPAAKGAGALETATDTDIDIESDEVLAESRPTLNDDYWRFVARVGLEVAEALEYAHGRGVLHRDIKPANLLLDERGSVWVTDFGLAKLVQQGDITATGDIIGTLQYMAPEGLQGQSDARSDVYGLGMTLYELLTLEPPYDESNPSRLIRRVSQEQPLPPRKRNPAIPRDLETIVLKATAREPADRYPTAAALGEDLRRFLDDRPVRARRATLTEQFGRWCRRNKPLAALGATALGSLLFAAVVGWVGYATTRRALEGESQRRHEADAATRRAEANVALSLQALEKIFNSLTPRPLGPPSDIGLDIDFPRDRRGGPGPGPGSGPGPRSGEHEPPPGHGPPPPRAEFEERQTALLQSILEFYDRFAALNETNVRLKREAAKAHRRIGEIRQRLGQFDAADAAFGRAVALFEGLAAELPETEDPGDRHALAEALIAHEPRPDAPEAALARWRRALSIEEQLAGEFPDDREYAYAVAAINGRLGALLARLGQAREAETGLRRALAVREELSRRSPEGSYTALLLATARAALGRFLLEHDRSAEGRTTLDAAAAELRAIAGRHPAPGTARLLTQQLEDLAALYEGLGETARAEELTADARALREWRPGGRRGGPGPGPGPGSPPRGFPGGPRPWGDDNRPPPPRPKGWDIRSGGLSRHGRRMHSHGPRG